ncbi:MAG: putative metal-binding motif-containing protein [Alphaproteobacteria bacterium]|nr:putative metal-binding motif-containing protein [Alphaproteobacteria bacterium]
MPLRHLIPLTLLLACGGKETPDSEDSEAPVQDSELPCEPLTFYLDADGDGQGDPASPIEACTTPEGAVAEAFDCDDSDPTVGLGFPERCDGVDNDCDGLVDREAGPTGWVDADGDGFGDAAAPLYTICPHPGVLDDSDCDDGDRRVHPGAAEPEACDGVDQDCDGAVDEGVGLVRYPDLDGDGQGDASQPHVGCPLLAQGVENDEDCDDSDPVVCEGCPELCDGKDNDCDGRVNLSATALGYQDADGDGYGVYTRGEVYDACVPHVSNNDDCHDYNANIHPGATEVCDGYDTDCDGTTNNSPTPLGYIDDDGDGYGDATRGLDYNLCRAHAANNDDCNDSSAYYNPGVSESCYSGVDLDCDGDAGCDDSECLADAFCLPESNCADGLDDDSDRLTDCDDPDCAADPVCNYERRCDDGLDDDADGDTDCDDADCAADAVCLPEGVCDDGLDDDSDGDVDCDDADCAADPTCVPETVCDDGLDNEGDGLVDCEDGDCVGDAACIEQDCTDGLDDDNDGLTDCDDEDCWGLSCGTMTTQVTGGGTRFYIGEHHHRESAVEQNSTGYRWHRRRDWYGQGADIRGIQGIATLRTPSGASSTCGWTVQRQEYGRATYLDRVWINNNLVSSSQRYTSPDPTRVGFALTSACTWTSVGSSILPQAFATPEQNIRSVYLPDGRPWYVATGYRGSSGGSGGSNPRWWTDSYGVQWSSYNAYGGSSSFIHGYGLDVGTTYTLAWPP